MRTFPRLSPFYVGSLAAQAMVLPSLFLSRFPYGSPLPGGEDPPPCRRQSLSPVRRLRHTTAIPQQHPVRNATGEGGLAVVDASALWRESSGQSISVCEDVRIPGVTHKNVHFLRIRTGRR